MSDLTVVAFDVLTKDNYNTWRMQAEALLVVSDLWDYVEEDTELISEDVDSRKLWMKQDKIAKSKLILHISSTLLPLIENCTTSREVWLKLANVYGNNRNSDTDDEDTAEKLNADVEDATENSDTKAEDATEIPETDDEDAIINDIENFVSDFFEIINDLSEKKIKEDEKSLSTFFTDDLFSRSNINSIEKLPDKQIIVNTISDFIDVISKLSKIEIKEQRNELSNKFIDILLVKFNISPHENDNDVAKSNPHEALPAEIRSKLIPFDACDVGENQSETINLECEISSEDESICSELLQHELQFNNGRTLCKSYGHENDNDVAKSNPYEALPAEIRSRLIPFDACDVVENQSETINPECEISSEDESICSELLQHELQFDNERTLCKSYGHENDNDVAKSNPYEALPAEIRSKLIPFDACDVVENQSETINPECEISSEDESICSELLQHELQFDNERTPCKSYSQEELENSVDPLANLYTPPPTPSTNRTYKSGGCRGEGLNRRTSPLNKPGASATNHTITTPTTPKRSYKCGVCREEGHNRRTCPLYKSAAASVSKDTAETYETPKKSYKCGICREEGHNRRTCPLNKPATVPVSKHTAATSETPKRSYKCGICREEGHNRTTCPLNKPAAASVSKHTAATPETPKRSYKCGVCREEGHNRTTCPLNKPAASASKYICASTSSETPKRSYKCGVCREEGHNRTTCPLNKPAASASKYICASTSSETPKRSYKCGVCREEGHNRTTCPLNKPAASASKYICASTSSETPKRSYKCGICREEGHNRTICPLNKSAASASKYIYASTSSETPKRSYKCGICREEGHNRTTCPLNKPAAVSASEYVYAITTHETPKRSYRCGGCGNEGHNIRSCPFMKSQPAVTSTPMKFHTNSVTSTASTRAAYRCGNSGGEGHNRRTCGRREASSSSYSTSSYSSYSSPAPSSSGGGRKYTCGNCGGSGHNRRTCTR